MAKPLEGIKVVEIGQEIQGPFAGLFLSDMGADVVKVENCETGDLSRWATNALIGGADARNPEVSAYFLAMNRGKRSITLDLKKPQAIEIVKRMAQNYDVLLTNYRPGVLDRLGLGFDDLLKVNPGLIYGQASSWGPKGPWVMRPSRDTLAQAASGVMIKTGTLDHPPLPAGMFVADHCGALSLASGIITALFVRERTGKGQRVDASIYGTLLAMQAWELNYTSLSGKEPERGNRCHPFLRGVWGAFATKDGYICLAGCDDKRWPSFCRVMGIEHLETDPDYDNPTRNFHGAKMEQVLDQIFPRKTTAQWLELLHEIDVLATDVATLPQILQSEQARANGYLMELDHPMAGKMMVPGAPISLNGEIETKARPAPEYGQHSEEILLELGFSWEQIGAMRDAGAV
ncbi:MAG TPA: CoA transferase [Candidatus Binataceae bacterium]|nr:CoA transferase [Candidatus Binataceae bacterium]